MSKIKRSPHANLDAKTRIKKAVKIEKALAIKKELSGAFILEVGTGSGVIAWHLGKCAGIDGKVTAVDVVDQRQEKDGYTFLQLEDTTLPFEDASFDIIVSNHVFEHVGGRTEQLHHLQEMRRVLVSDGLVYFAVPNRWSIIEPHHKLPFLSWLPKWLSDMYVRLVRRGEFYDCDRPVILS